jgi:hypothetical protein
MLRIKHKQLNPSMSIEDAESNKSGRDEEAKEEKQGFADFNPTPDPSPFKQDFDYDEMNGDIKQEEENAGDIFAHDYNTMQIKPHKSQLLKKNIEDGLPTILEQSGAEPLGDDDKFLDGFKTKPAETVRNSDVHGLHSMTALKLQYKHRRMQSKNALFNKYKSLSLMNGDDMTSQILH